MKNVMKQLIVWALFALLLAGLLAAPPPANAQTGPEATPQEGYPPPATPAQPETAYPAGQPAPTAVPLEEGYIAPTEAISIPTSPPAIIGDSATQATAVPTLSISQSTLVRNRAILWAGFLITLLIFAIAVYGAILMYTRRQT